MFVGRRSFLSGSGAVAAAATAVAGSGARVVLADSPAAPGAGPGAALGTAEIFSADRIHMVEIAADPKELHWLDDDRSHHVACDVTIDGERYSAANFSERGTAGSAAALADKSSFAVRFGKERPKDLKKLWLKNSRQDDTYVHEHLTSDLFRRAGLPSYLTSHGVVYLNGAPYGVFVLIEAMDTTFLQKWFGKGTGNFYQASSVDFAVNYLDRRITNENDDDAADSAGGVDPAKRADLAALADAVNTPDDDEFLVRIRERLDLDSYLTYFALEGVVADWDGPAFNVNNYCLYHNPADDRMVLVARDFDIGYDVTFDPLKPPVSRLAQRIRAIAELNDRWSAEIGRIMDTVWDLEVMFSRIDQVVRLFRRYEPPRGRVADDVSRILGFAPGVKNLLDARRAQWIEGLF